MHSPRFASAVLVTLATLTAAAATAAPEFNPVAHEPRAVMSDGRVGVIVKLRKDGAGAVFAKLASGSDRTDALARRTGLAMSLKREISASMLASIVDIRDASPDEVLERLRADPAVEFAVPDRRRFPQAVPNDPLFANQWYLQNAEVSAVNAVGAWDRELGTTGIVIAVLDTGVLYDHPDLGRGDLGGKLLPGYDFVSGVAQANDDDGRDANPSDPGDWVLDSERSNPAFSGCAVGNSSWHGTRVAGMIGARSNNSVGITGLDWNSFILPVRVLGKCGGTDSDILAGMRWAAGLSTQGAPANPTPARVLNMSLGASSPCEASYRSVIDELTALKVLVVISAGNEGTVVSSPANRPGVAAIAAIRHAGSKVGFSSLGPEVALGAPGGNCVNVSGGPCLFSLDTTANTGTTSPAVHTYTDQQNSNLGTSFSAPIVSGIAGLMLSRNANLSTSQLLTRLRESATPFPPTVADLPTIENCHVPLNDQDLQLAQCLCTATTCGAGMVNAANAVEDAGRPIAAVALPGNVVGGQNVALNASGSAAACGRSLSSFAWTVVAPGANPPTIVGANTANATVIAPISGSFTVRVTVTDDQNRTDSADVVVEVTLATSSAPASAGAAACAAPVTSGVTPTTPPPPPPPPPVPTPTHSGGGGGGGGTIGLPTLFLLGVLSLQLMRRRRRAHFSRCI